MRIGVFGGTFDPPHFGHLVLAMEALHKLELDQLLWVVTASPPHKQHQVITPVEHRFEMVKTAIQSNPHFQISRIEIDRSGPHYVADTLKLLKEQFPQAELCYLIGGDSLRDLPEWFQPEQIIQAITFLGVMRRPEDDIDLDQLEKKLSGVSEKVKFFETPLLDISSTEIRDRIANNEPFRYFLLPEVYRLIVKCSYYQRIHS